MASNQHNNEASERYRRVLLRAESVNRFLSPLLAKKPSNTGKRHDLLEVTQHENGDFLSALETKQRELDNARKMHGEEHPNTAESYYSLGITQHQQRDFISALKTNKQALDLRIKLFGEVHLKTADSYDLLGLTQQEQGDFTSAIESNTRALGIRRKLLGEEHRKTADSYYSLGVTQHSLGDFISALQSNKRALEIRLKLFGEKHQKTADSYYSLGATQHSLGDHISAHESVMRALDIRLKLFGKEHPKTADSYYSLAATQHSLGDLISASESNKYALDIRLKQLVKEQLETADSYDLLGLTQHSLGDYISALGSKKRALDIKLKQLGEEHSKTADIYYSLGVTQHALGDVISAIESTKRALGIRRKLLGEEHPKTADSYDLLGLTQHEKGHLNSALESNRRALDIRRKLLGEEHPKTADSYYSLGVTQHSLGDHISAFESSKCALDIRRKLFGEQHPKTADSYYSLGVAQHSLGNFGAVFESNKRALDIRHNLFGELHPETTDYYHLLQRGKNTSDSYVELALGSEQPKPSARYTSYPAGETSENELEKDIEMATEKEDQGDVEAVGIVNYKGGVVVAEDVHVICPYGAIGKQDDDVTIKITLEKPSTHCDMIVKSGLENDVMFIAPVINLQPNGQVFKRPVTVTTKLTNDKEASLRDVLILHGAQAKDGKIVWEDITHKSTIDLEKKERNVEIEGFSRIAALLRLTSILTKDIITRLNLIGFNYTLSVLFKDNYPHTAFGELGLFFMSRDVYHEKCFREHPSSVLMQLRGNGFEELCSIDRPESNRIYNNESLKVSVLLGQDYELTDGPLESTDFIVESSTWWSTGHAIKLSLKGTDGVRILCGRIGIQGQYGHVLEETFCELDRCGYVMRQLRLEGSILNLVPIAQKLDVPGEAINEAIRTWKNDEEQLKIVLQQWSKEQDDGCKEDPAVLRNTLEGLNPEDCEVNERGKMHISHLRELAFEIQGLNREDPHLKEYFTNQIKTLCDSILKDCCIEMDAEVSVENCPRFLSFHQRVTEDVALKLEKICSSNSTRSVNEDFFYTVPFLIQAIKEIFRQESPLIVQNGLKGLSKELVSQHESKVRDAFLNQDILRLVYEVCGVLENLCLNNCEKHSTEVIENWGESLGIWNMSEFLKGFFQGHQDSKLYKRLQLFSRSLRRISADIRDVNETEMRYFYDFSLNLIKFATFDPSKLVRFETTDSTNSPVTCYCEPVKYDRPHDTFSQQFEIRKQSEDELQLGAIAHVHLDGRIREVGAFKSVITLPPSSEEELARCSIATLPVTVKRERTNSGNFRVVLSSTRKKNVAEALRLLQRYLGDDIVDGGQAEITESPLMVRCFVEGVEVVRLRLLYKWGSEAISVDSKDFVAIDESSATDAYMSASDSDASSPFEAELAALSIASRPGDKNGNFVMDPSAMELIQRHARQQCGRLELHLHQTFQKGHVCVTGENTSLHMEMPNTAQSFLQEGLCAPSQKSITAGPSSNDAAVSEQEKNKTSEMEEIEV